MKMMGMTEFPYWLSWLTYYTIIMTLICFVCSLILLGVYPKSNKILVYMYLWLYGMSLFSYSVFISSFFSNGKVASIAGSFLLFFSSWLMLIVQDPSGSIGLKHLFSICPTVSI